jgi:hypothetical protein
MLNVPRPRHAEGIPSYKKDAIKLIFQRLQRYMIDIFRQIERVGIDKSIQKQREMLASFYEELKDE